VLVAEESAGVRVLNELVTLRPAVNVVAVLTGNEGVPHGRPLVREAARKLGLETLPADLVRSASLVDRFATARVDLLVNVHSLFIVHPDVLAVPTFGSFNLHPGPLPQYAGLNVASWAIYNGERTHGVTLHWMDEGIDTGPVALSASFTLMPTDTGLSVSGKCVRHGIRLVRELMRTALEDPSQIPRLQQERKARRYYPAGPPTGGRLEWGATAEEIVRFVRAADYAPFPSPWGAPRAELGGIEVGIAKAKETRIAAAAAPGTIVTLSEKGAEVAAADQLVLVQKVVVDGRRRIPAEVLPH
jgi:UDP-4-amino-4-deoxy-L-arabinose formyltransferase/UDP-glucuronic acid dehydrogenase (UDP-4-keto-hexauronic acid decarboxylating)